MALLSVILPSYNEKGNIANTAKVLSETLTNAEIEYELIFVSDGSTDGTYEAIQEESKKNSKVKGLEFSRNFGKEASIFAGLSVACGDACIVMDCDLQHPADIVPKMYKLWEEGFEIVEGVKSSRGKEGIFHKAFAGIFYGIMSKLIKMDMKNSSDFKLIDRKVVNVLLELKEHNTFFRALTFWAGFKTTTISYDVAERQYGTSKWSFRSLFRYAILNATSFSTLPLQLITHMGIICIVFSIILGIQTLVKYFMGHAMEGFTTVILLILIVGGFVMLSLGIVGHYLARIYEEVKGRPKFIIKQTTDNIHGNV
ncbi:dolichol-phosphate mannosyltransferase [Lachnospiraceae bacterium G11]|nr:dolichol-phosphate mannosyltransferase [Lachnospiraceae bacterium G11]